MNITILKVPRTHFMFPYPRIIVKRLLSAIIIKNICCNFIDSKCQLNRSYSAFNISKLSVTIWPNSQQYPIVANAHEIYVNVLIKSALKRVFAAFEKEKCKTNVRWQMKIESGKNTQLVPNSTSEECSQLLVLTNSKHL